MEGRWKVGFFDCIPSVQRTTSEQLEGVLREQKEREGEVSQLKASLEQGVQDCKTQTRMDLVCERSFFTEILTTQR